MTNSSTLGSEPSDRLPGLMRFACWAFGLSLLLAIVSARCLYADGSHEFVRVLEAGTFVELMRVRAFAFDLFELPLVIALKLGVTNMNALRLAFGLGCFLPWPLALLVCHRLSPKHFWIAALACAAGYLNAAFMPVGEHIIAHAFFWPALFALVFVRPLTSFAAVALLVTATILCRTYESLLFLGPPLAAISWCRAIRGGEEKWQRWVLSVTGALFALAAIIALYAVVRPEIPSNLTGFKHGVLNVLLAPNWSVRWSAAWLLIMLAVFASPAVRGLITHHVSVIILGAALAVWGSWPLLSPSDLDPVAQHEARFLDVVVPLLLLPVALILAWRPAWMEIQRAHLAAMSAAFLLVQSVWQIGTTWQWHGYVGIWRGLLAARAGPIWLADTPLAQNALGGQALRFDWFWANPCLSIALSSEGRVRSIIMNRRPPFWQPFDPLDSQQLPDLRRYGIDFTSYVTTLEALKAASATNTAVAMRK